MSAGIDTIVSEENKRCALKLLGIELGNLKDEEILEFISNYVQPSAIKALFYDTFNSFYVLHLSDAKSTCLLVGKTLQMSCYRVHFLPLFDSFVIGNVYMNVTNNDLRDIFSTFGNVFEVKNYHVLPNSSKFCHVLSGTREISFLLPGKDIDVEIPVTVMSPPYTFHIYQLCSGCLTQGHSLLSCPERENAESHPLPTITHIAGNLNGSLNENSLVIKQELVLESSKEDVLKEKSPEVGRERVMVSEEKNTNETRPPKKLRDSQELEGIVLSDEEENILPKKKNMFQEKSQIVINRVPQVNKETNPSPTPPTEKTKQDSTPRCVLEISPVLERWIHKVNGVLPSHDMIELMQIDARNKKNIISFVSNITTDLKVVVSQLKKIRRIFYQEEYMPLGVADLKCSRKLSTLINVLNEHRKK